jgi:AAA+ superfamily predicted ATPase
MIDPIVEEIHKIREEYAAKFEYDVDAMFEDLRQKQSQSNRKIVSFVKKKSEKQGIDERKVA